MELNDTLGGSQQDELILEALPVQEIDKPNWFLNDNWYALHPDKVLGHAYETTGRFGKVVKYKGSIEDVSRIDTYIEQALMNAKDDEPLQSEVETYIKSAELVNPETADFISDAIENSNRNVGKKISEKKQKDYKVEGDSIVFKEPELQTFEDVWRTYNDGISLDELEVYIWHKTQIGRPLSRQWVNLVEKGKYKDGLNEPIAHIVEEGKINEWVKKGLVYYYEDRLVPAMEYLSGNMYDKRMQIDKDKDEIVEKYGEVVYQRQVIDFNNAWKSVYDSRLTIGQSDDSLVVLPISNLAKEFKIARLASMPEDSEGFKIKLVSAQSDPNFGRPNWSKDDDTSDWKKDKVESLSLVDAFNYYLLKIRPELRLPISHLDIVNYYCLGKKMQISPFDDTEKAKKEADAKKEKLKSSTQLEGERLFKIFLDTELEPNDKVRLETEWNSNYNNYKPIDLNKIPVAFNMCRKYKGSFERLQPEKREAVAFSMHTGSGILAYGVGVGKGNLLTSNILTPSGYVKMGTIKIGDEVIGKNGLATKVNGVFPLGKVQCYKVTFTDGSSTEVSDEHIWSVQTISDRSHGYGFRNVETKDILNKLYNYRGNYQYSIPMVNTVEFIEKELPLHPYVLGCLLGDGSLSNGSIVLHNPEVDVQQKVRLLLPEYLTLNVAADGITCGLSRKASSGSNDLYKVIEDLGLRGTVSNSKFIPQIYKINSSDNRIELLRGLLDTDGYLQSGKNGKKGCLVQYTTVSKQLCDDVVFLVQSFGGTCIVNEKYPTYTHNGEKRTGQLAYTISIRLPRGIMPVSSLKHTKKFVEKSKYQPVRFIKSIEDIGFHEAQCIRVDAEDSLYVCDDFIVTHNTPSAIYSMSAFLDAGYANRLCLVVPNQVYKQFISEIRSFAPHIPIIEGYNLSEDYFHNFRDVNGNIANTPTGSVTVLTYEGFERIGFNEYTQHSLMSGLYDILNQGGEDERITSKKGERAKASFQEKLETLLGKGLSGTTFNIEDFGFDFMCYDEAHKMKKVFCAVKGEVEEKDGKQSRGRNPYVINSGTPSSIALKGFMINYYIQQNNFGGNVLMLTATPFTNSPLEIFSMLSMVAYEKLRDTNLNNIKTFFDTYVKASTQLVINSKLRPEFKQVILGFNNLISLQTLIRRFINYKTGEEVGVQRPNKYVLPYLSETIDGITTRLSENEKVETYIPMTPLQTRMMESIISYVEGNGVIDEDSFGEGADVEEDVLNDSEAVEIDESDLSSEEKTGVRIIKGITYARNLALSPHLFVKSGLTNKPDYKAYVEMSPKLKYVMLCIKSVRDYHIAHNEPVSGQVIYMDRGIVFFPLLKEYLIKEVGYKEHEIGIIQSGLPKNGKRSKEYIKNLFNGEVYNETTKLFDSVSDEERIKIVIGSSTIKEGINLQKFGTVLYNCFIDWNPTDIKQLEGRVWRQGNEFNAVRIVNPLVIDSADIFLFEKLRQKTSRLNTIWATDGKKNVLNLEEFNPEELKYALIRDPKVIAELKSIEEKAAIEGELLGYNRQLEQIDKLKANASTINSHFKSAAETIKPYRDIQFGNDKLEDAVKLVRTTLEIIKSEKDKEGKKLVHSWERDVSKNTYESWDAYQKRKEDAKEYSKLDPLYKPYWFSDFSLAVRDTFKMVKEIVNQYGISFSIDDFSGLDLFKEKVNKNIEEARERQKYYESAEYKEQVEREVIEKRIEDKLEYKPLEASVFDFGKLNYLLSDKKVSNKKKVTYPSLPPVDANEVRLIDRNAISYLTDCIENEGQTKDLWFVDGVYQAERQALHDEIIRNLFKEVKCVSQGKPIAVFTGGSPASGKTHFIKEVAPYLIKEDVFHLDADDIRAMLPEYKGWNASTTHKETQDIVNEILQHIGEASCRYDFIYDGTMNRAEKYFPLIRKVQQLGYETYIIFLDIPYAVAYKRSLERYQKTGRYVPVQVIDDFFMVKPNSGGMTMGQYALNELKPIVNGYIVVDGLTGNILEKSGEAFPKDRSYGKTVSIEPVIEKIDEPVIEEVLDGVEEAPTKESISDAIEALDIMAEMGDKEALEAVEALKVLLDFYE